MTSYVPHTEEDFARMLGDTRAFERGRALRLLSLRHSAWRAASTWPPVSPSPTRRWKWLAWRRANRAATDLICFAGGGAYDHDIPAVTRALAGRSEFVTSYTPYQPEVAQGVLQALFEYQTLVSRLAGLPVANASVYDGATATVEAVNLAVAATGRETVWVSAGLNPRWRQALVTLTAGKGVELVDVPLVDGVNRWEVVAGRGGPATAAHLRLWWRLPQLPRLHRSPLAGKRGSRQGRGVAGGCL